MSASVRSNWRRFSGRCSADTESCRCEASTETTTMKESRRTSSSPSFFPSLASKQCGGVLVLGLGVFPSRICCCKSSTQ
ncbi:hypothetical protein A2U01_0064637 [Trifolium medium]|uniref:Uncharacterized protein n=1 Tax=Trifolium medium TaxID=97028 RepID=A0A392S5Y0_9FABA|nr:hypothetical protein [Trifolium medium]